MSTPTGSIYEEESPPPLPIKMRDQDGDSTSLRLSTMSLKPSVSLFFFYFVIYMTQIILCSLRLHISDPLEHIILASFFADIVGNIYQKSMILNPSAVPTGNPRISRSLPRTP